MTKFTRYFPILFTLSLIALILPFLPLESVSGINIEKGIIVLVMVLLVFSIIGSIAYNNLLTDNPEKIKDSSLKNILTKSWYKPLSTLSYFIFIAAMVIQGQTILMVLFIVLAIASYTFSETTKDPIKALAKERGIEVE